MSSTPPPPNPKSSTSSRRLAPPPLLRPVAAAFFGIAKRTRSVRLPPVPPRRRARTIRLARVNVVHGVSGSGRTSLVRMIEARPRGPRRAAAIAPGPRDVDRLSGGQQIVVAGPLLLGPAPAAGCLLVDDGLEHLDDDNFDRFVAAQLASGKQVVIAAKSPDVERLRMAVGISGRGGIHLTGAPGGVEMRPSGNNGGIIVPSAARRRAAARLHPYGCNRQPATGNRQPAVIIARCRSPVSCCLFPARAPLGTTPVKWIAHMAGNRPWFGAGAVQVRRP